MNALPDSFLQSAQWQRPTCTGSPRTLYRTAPQRHPPVRTPASTCRWYETARCASSWECHPDAPDNLRFVAVSEGEARSLALSLSEAVELDHHGRPSFRVGGKIFATLWNEGRMNVMLDEGGILTAVGSAPDVCEKVWWGKRLTAVGVTLARIDQELLSDLLTDAWEQKAPKRLVRG
jgi:hypothetical protein